MSNLILLTEFKKILGDGSPTSRGNYKFKCFNCNHTKKKLEVNFDESSADYGKFGCWVCGLRGKSFHSLLKKANVSKHVWSTMMPHLPLLKSTKIPQVSIDNAPTIIQLPDGFKSLKSLQKSDIEGRHALNYLKKRNITKGDIFKYNIGYCESGFYAKRIIIPVYNVDSQLIYFIARSYVESNLNYLIPKIPRDFVANEHMINWSLPIVLCEGIFDAISAKNNAIPLLGKNISNELQKRLITEDVRDIYICLDSDALRESLRICEHLMNEGKNVYLVDIKDKDINNIGFENFNKLLMNTKKLTYIDLFKEKLKL